jgi:conjugal transfer pilus assembly protein TraW
MMTEIRKPHFIKKVISSALAPASFLSLCSLFACMPIYANDLGVYGAIFSISEPDMLDSIYSRLDSMQKNGELEKYNEAFKTRVIEHIVRPAPVAGVSDLDQTKPGFHYYNPTMIVNHDISDALGNVIAHKGDWVNPLQTMQFNEILYFIDGDNAKQMAWMKKQIAVADQVNQSIKVILVNGNIQTSAKALNERVYFDQYGKLCQTFGIKHTPTVVYQPINNGMIVPRLMVKEVSDVF